MAGLLLIFLIFLFAVWFGLAYSPLFFLILLIALVVVAANL